MYCRKVADLKLFISLANNQNLLNGVSSRSESVLVISYQGIYNFFGANQPIVNLGCYTGQPDFSIVKCFDYFYDLGIVIASIDQV